MNLEMKQRNDVMFEYLPKQGMQHFNPRYVPMTKISRVVEKLILARLLPVRHFKPFCSISNFELTERKVTSADALFGTGSFSRKS